MGFIDDREHYPTTALCAGVSGDGRRAAGV